MRKDDEKQFTLRDVDPEWIMPGPEWLALQAENERLTTDNIALNALLKNPGSEITIVRLEAENARLADELARVTAAAKMVLNGLDHITYTGSEEAATLMDTAWAQLDRVLRGPGKDWEEEQGA